MNSQEKYWSLNGAFGTVSGLLEIVDNNEIQSLDDLKIFLFRGMNDINNEMMRLEDEIGIEQGN